MLSLRCSGVMPDKLFVVLTLIEASACRQIDKTISGFSGNLFIFLVGYLFLVLFFCLLVGLFLQIFS